MIEQQRPSKDWTISIFDGEGINFARVPNPQETIGKRASPSLYAEMFRKPEATLPTVSLEGVPLITSIARSSLTGWTVAAGIAESSLVAPAVAQSRDHQRDRRRAAAGRPCLCGADGDHDRPRRDAARSPDRGAQPPRQEHARDPAVDRDADLSQRQPGRAREIRRPARRAGGGAQSAEPGEVAGLRIAGRDRAGAAALSAQQSGADADVRTDRCRCRRGSRWCCR